MNILITGATGLIGSQLTSQLIKHSHGVTALVRDPKAAKQKLPASVTLISSLAQYTTLNTFDAVINLAGEPIFDQRWTAEQKQRLVESRVNLTAQLVQRINASRQPPHTFISGSATGYYGNKSEEIITENAPATDTFPSQLCQRWESEALCAKTRVCLLRTGIVLSKTGGALAKMLPLYRLGLGGKLGSGKQYWAWIALDDMVKGILFLLENHQCQGAFNLVSPNPIRHAEFNSTLASILKRPAFATVPEWLLRFFLGERTQLLLDSQKIVPEKLLTQGFTFDYPELKSALQAILK
ncbi:TIGR01777 family oxidoreductase [Pasteurella multocida]|uniref:TIGR01777 family oxidoreductase n=1 Tax=Pasteurella multocida TaxID=747 RepID=UPI002022567B|nr:TIGR01777 family oxidoreductase [Pasteurella multocida]MCL7818267.1 TIGR01777 family oxidoreductase [Pasteurella multocida]MEB3451058.1 TIGR01777 family oxidoreductase [Pasteurella multocida]MEB3457079.1 TIGR01777 family oxidoreductase [Pasteurella multocida]MEB3460357.1 TIGR01777 family oxidoreductase [Pasteurella multocida]MEB3462265.1 TIGR01777 family oxidoreductase [Pasteurella multocida]